MTSAETSFRKHAGISTTLDFFFRCVMQVLLIQDCLMATRFGAPVGLAGPMGVLPLRKPR